MLKSFHFYVRHVSTETFTPLHLDVVTKLTNGPDHFKVTENGTLITGFSGRYYSINGYAVPSFGLYGILMRMPPLNISSLSLSPEGNLKRKPI